MATIIPASPEPAPGPRTHWLRVLGYALFTGGGMAWILWPGVSPLVAIAAGLGMLAVVGGG